MNKFKVGDAVRVKAGSPKKLWRHGFTWDASHSFGEKLIVEECCSNDKFENRVHLVDGHGVIENCYLEPWNDSEEWDASSGKWVAKPIHGVITERHLDIKYYNGDPPATLTINGVKYLREEPTPVSPLLDAMRSGLGIVIKLNGVEQIFIVQNYEHDYETGTDIATIKSISTPRKVGS